MRSRRENSTSTMAFLSLCRVVKKIHPLAIPAPYNHSNIDSDEVLYYVDGDFMSRNNIEQGHISTASCILANMSMKTGRPLVYDPKERRIINDVEANNLLQRPYRQPWVHPDPFKV